MTGDPIIDEVRGARRAMLAEAGGDMHRLAERFRLWEVAHPGRMASPTVKTSNRAPDSPADAIAETPAPYHPRG